MQNATPSLLLASLAALLAGACSSDVGAAAPVLRFSAIPDDDRTELAEKYGAIARYLADELGVAVRYQAASDYQASVDMFKNGDVQLAWFGGLTGCRARAAVDGARAIAQGVVDPQFRSYFIAGAESGLQPCEEFPLALAGHTFTFGEPGSTSGRLMPEHFIRRFTGRTPVEFFGHEMAFSMSHDQTAVQVQNGTFDAGALNYKTYDRMVAEGVIDPRRCRVIWTTPPYPDYSWNAHPELERTFGPGFIDRLQRALVGMSEPGLLAAAQREEGLIPASNEEFAPLVELATELGLMRE